jgi:hypothetical protein
MALYEYTGVVAEIPFGKAGMTARANRLLASPDELLVGAAITLEDALARKEGGAVLYDTNGLVGAPAATATLSVSNVWAGTLTTYKGSGIAFDKLVGSGTSTAAGATLTLTVAAGGVASGSSIVISAAAFALSALSVTVTDSAGNVYVTEAGKVSASGPTVFTVACHNCLALLAAQTITLTFSIANLVRAAVANSYTGLTTTPLDRNGSASGSSVSFSAPTTAALSQVPELIVGSGSATNVGPATATATLGFTKSGDVNTGTGSLHVHVWQEYRIDTTTPSVVALFDWWPDSSTQRIITASMDGSLYKDDGAGNLDATVLKSGLSTTARGRFTQAGKEAAAVNRKLFYFNGTNIVQRLSGNGATTADLATPPADWSGTNQPVNGLVHNFRLVGFGNVNDPHRIYFSDPDDHENFTSAAAFSMRVSSHIGDRLWGGASFNGVLFLWKHPRGIFYLDDSDIDATNWETRVKSEGLGCAPTPYAVLPLDDDIMFLAANGSFHLLSAVDTLGGTRASDLSYALGLSDWLRNNVNLSRLSQVTSVWYPHKKVALWGVPSRTQVGDTVILSTTNDMILKFDWGGVQHGEPVKFSYTPSLTPDALAIRRSTSDGVERPIMGSSAFVFTLDDSTRSRNGAGYASTIQTPHTDLAYLSQQGDLRRKRKMFEHLEFIMEPVTAGTLSAQVYVDGVAKGSPLTVDCTRRRQKFALQVGDGHTFSVAITSSSAAADDFKLLSLLIYFKAGNEDQSR